MYNAESIKTLSFLEAIRTRVAMYMGSADNNGVLQCIREIITNSIDEATMGFGNEIRVTINEETNFVSVEDNARGVPFGAREDGVDAMEAIYTMSHTGGKFDEKIYQNVAGINGVGAKGTALSSSHFKAISHRGDKKCTLILKDGIKQSLKIESHTGSTGTYVEFVPAQEVYNLESISISITEVEEMCRNWSYLTPNVKFIVINELTGQKKTFLAKDGLIDLLLDNPKKKLHKTPLHFYLEEDGNSVEVVLSWVDARQEEWHVFTNGLENPNGGTPLTGMRTSITNFFKKKFKKDFPSDLVRKSLYYAVACKVKNPSFANQTKSKINNPELRGLAQKATTQALEKFERESPKEFEVVLELLSKELKAEVAAERARKQVLEMEKEIIGNQKRKVFASTKLKDASELGPNSTLLLVEGNSAGSGMAQARDYTKFGILTLRGKPINPLSNDEEKVLQNEEIKLILSALNIVPGRYSASKLRYGRVAICSDSDSDGSHIGLLIMSIFYTFAPDLIKEGRLYWLRAPLFVVTHKGINSYYYTNEEYEAAAIPKGAEVSRAKGLGSLDADEAQDSMFNEKNQRLEQLVWDESSFSLLEDLMGSDVEARRDFVMQNVRF